MVTISVSQTLLSAVTFGVTLNFVGKLVYQSRQWSGKDFAEFCVDCVDALTRLYASSCEMDEIFHCI
jgi:hypothetical protein